MSSDERPVPDVWAIARDYAPQLGYCERLLDVAWELRAYGLELTDRYRLVHASILGRSISTYRAAVELVKLGLSIQSLMLSRSLFEDLVAALWLSLPEKREDALGRIFQQEDAIASVAEKVTRKHQYRLTTRARLDPELEAMERELDKAFGPWGSKTWFPDLRTAVTDVEPEWERRGGAAGELTLYYDVFQRHANQHLHNTVLGLRRAARGSVNLGTAKRFSYGQSGHVDESEVMTSLSCAAFCFRSLATVVIDETTGRSDALAEVSRDSSRIFDELRPSNRRRGRNDPCWCDSGKKLSDCHEV